MAVLLDNLYDRVDFFALTAAGETRLIDEPQGWDKILIALARDPDYYGMVYQFVEGDIQLTFAYDVTQANGLSGGGMWLKELMETKGPDVSVQFQYGYFLLGVANVLFDAKVNLNTYERQNVGVVATVEAMPFNALLRTRWSAKVDVSSAVSQDNAPITPAQSFDVKLFSKEIVKKTSSATDPFNLYSDTSGDNTHFYPILWIQPDTENIITNEAPLLNSMPPGILHAAPWDSSLYQYQPAETGSADITYTTSGKYQFYNGDNFNFQINIRQYRSGSLFNQYQGTFQNINIHDPEVVGGLIPFNDTFTATLNLILGDQIYINVQIVAFIGTTSVNTNWASYSEHGDSITISQKTTAPPSSCNSYNLFDLCNHLVYSNTGFKDAVISDFFGPGGQGHNYAIANGYAVRNFSTNIYPLSITLQTTLESMAAIWNIGIVYTLSPLDGSPQMRIERMPTFFSGALIRHFNNVSKYSEKQDNSQVYNLVTVGYETYATDEVNTLDEFNTYHQYLMPIKTYSNPFEKKSSFIASGYSIEFQRREQFKDAPSTSLSNDDDPFIISYHEGTTPTANSTDKFAVLTGVLSPGTTYNGDITPKQIFYNWSDLFNGFMALKDDAEVIKNTFAKNNGDLTTQLRGTVPTTNKEYYTLVERADVILSDYNDRSYCYTPMSATFNTYLKWDEMQELVSYLSGTSGTDKDFGYITYVNDMNEYWKAHVFSIKYNPVLEEATIIVKKVQKYQ